MRISDWSSDVCSSDLEGAEQPHVEIGGILPFQRQRRTEPFTHIIIQEQAAFQRHRDAVAGRAAQRGRRAGCGEFIDTGVGVFELGDRMSVVTGKSVSVRVDLGGLLIIKKKKNIYHNNL